MSKGNYSEDLFINRTEMFGKPHGAQDCCVLALGGRQARLKRRSMVERTGAPTVQALANSGVQVVDNHQGPMVGGYDRDK